MYLINSPVQEVTSAASSSNNSDKNGRHSGSNNKYSSPTSWKSLCNIFTAPIRMAFLPLWPSLVRSKILWFKGFHNVSLPIHRAKDARHEATGPDERNRRVVESWSELNQIEKTVSGISRRMGWMTIVVSQALPTFSKSQVWGIGVKRISGRQNSNHGRHHHGVSVQR